MTETRDDRSPEAILDLVGEVEREAPGGAETLYMAAMLADAPLPYDFALSVEGTPHNPALVNPAAAFFAATAMMDPLVNRALVDADADHQVFILPADVRETLRGALDEEQAAEWAGRAVYALNLSLPDADPQQWPLVQWLMPHVLACRDLVADLGVHTAAANRVLHQTGFSLYYQQRYKEAAELLEAAMSVDVALKGDRHPDITADLEGLATVYWAGEDLPRAEATFKACLELQREIFTENNPAMAPVLNGLAMVLQACGDLAGAEAALNDCLAVLRASNQERHPAAASCLHNLALLMDAVDQPEQGLKYALESLELTTALYGEHHPETASSHNLTGLLFERLGKAPEAEAHFRKSLSIYVGAYGEDHPETGQALCNLALFLDSRGQTQEALDCFERGFAAYERSLGPEHPYMENALDNLVSFLERTASSDSPLREQARARLKQIVEKAG
ncbi:tetratricopeptide repeat protein [uncultured Pseudodesulfovibrio sp.]|uniref:tetratricopeptide repeat protein n=1 Tax=uncultured Pseudodesulfovibrio sp. TaxID=2035858 RepID=UPI0029C82DC3|nr:tetratricopeptide repeat protein [uncultured Pseudodesulfovibrio sp.]